MDELRFLSQPSPRMETQVNTQLNPMLSPSRNVSRLQPTSPVTSHDPRTNLPRRFTAESGCVPTISTVTAGAAPRTAPPATDYSSTLHKVQLIEKKKQEYERLREQKRRFELEMQKIDQQQRKEEKELAQMQEDLGFASGNQSEPTTPPEYRETSSGFPTFFSRPNRYSTSSLIPSQGLFAPSIRSSSQLASPQASYLHQSQFSLDDQLPLRSLTVSSRNSDEDEKELAVRQDPTSHRSSNHLNRYSMPVTRSRKGLYDAASLDQTNTTRFLFGDESAFPESQYSQGDNSDDSFLGLSRGEQMSLSSLNGITKPSGSSSEIATVGSRPSSIRQSLDLKFLTDNISESQVSLASSSNHIITAPPKLQNSYSTSDIPTVKTTGGLIMGSNNHAQQHLHHHNASIGRIPVGAAPSRHNRELSVETHTPASVGRDQAVYASLGSTLQASAPSFGSSLAAPAAPTLGQLSTNQGLGHFGGTFYPAAGYNGITPGSSSGFANAPFLTMGMGNMSLSGNYATQPFSNFGGSYLSSSPPQRDGNPPDSQARVIQSRRMLDNEQMNKYQNLPLESLVGQIYDLCKDQHGCRYLQRKMEERDAKNIHLIWTETHPHVIELMTDPFGNYLCQKLLEYCDDEERTMLIEMASQDMIHVALNQHGTRALQKMIEFVSTPQQIQLIIAALRYNVVDLIQDHNGNHVIQKCLNKLSHIDSAFIFEAVGNHCVEVGTHRHGCCVLQRCIDHAIGDQKAWLVQRITDHAIHLVEDPFGNYVVQYIIDLNEPTFTEPLVAMFKGRIIALSRHKFSSNVIEKCLRCSQDVSKDMIVGELLVYSDMERILRDSFANYVVQTALDYATPSFRHRFVEAIRPHLPSIRTTPYGRRIQAKIQLYDNHTGVLGASQNVHTDSSHGQAHAPSLGPTASHRHSRPTSNAFAGGSGHAHSFIPSSAVIVPDSEYAESHVQHSLPPPLGAQTSQISMQSPGDSSRANWI